MVRKTKEQALATRSALLDAAEHLFQAHGVSRTSLQAIAAAADVTRGAVYWHFKDKGELFNAMMERACLPMEQSTAALERDAAAAPLKALQMHVMSVFTRIVADRQMQRVFEIAIHKVEYVDELSAVRQRHLARRHDYTAKLARALRAAQKRGEILPTPGALQLAIGLYALIDGLIQNWMLDPAAFDLGRVGRRALKVHLAGLAAAIGTR